MSDLIGWCAEQPLWVRDAVRRIASDETLPNIKSAVAARIKRHNGIGSEELSLVPVTADHLMSSQTDDETVLLCSIGPPENIDQLDRSQTLRFALNGITLIFGENATGKSGYTRMAKQLCRARKRTPLQSNAYTSTTTII